MSSLPCPIPPTAFSAMPSLPAPVPPIQLAPPPPPAAPPPGFRPPRPANAWIIFRREMLRNWPAHLPRPIQGKMSTHFKKLWDKQTPAERAVWDQKAEEAKAEHKLKYPNYKYCPMKKEEKQRLLEAKKQAALEKKQAKRVVSKGGASSRATLTGPISVAQSTRQNPYYIPPSHPMPGIEYHPGGPSPTLSIISLPDEEQPSPTPSTSTGSTSAAPSPFPATALVAPASPLPFPIIVAAPVASAPIQLPQLQVSNATVSDALPSAIPESEIPVDFSNIDVSQWGLFDAASVNGYDWSAGMTASNGTIDPSLMTLTQNTFDNVNAWIAQTGGASFDTQLSQMSGLQAYELLQFDDSANDYSGVIEVNVGPLPTGSELPSYFIPEESYGDIEGVAQVQEDFSADIFSEQFLVTPLFNEQETAQFTLPSLSDAFPIQDSFFGSALQPLDNAFDNCMLTTTASSSQTYTPPTGAANAGLRRVGGTYKKPPTL